MNKEKKRLVVTRETLRELTGNDLRQIAGGSGASNDASNRCCCPTDPTITCQTTKCI